MLTPLPLRHQYDNRMNSTLHFGTPLIVNTLKLSHIRYLVQKYAILERSWCVLLLLSFSVSHAAIYATIPDFFSDVFHLPFKLCIFFCALSNLPDFWILVRAQLLFVSDRFLPCLVC